MEPPSQLKFEDRLVTEGIEVWKNVELQPFIEVGSFIAISELDQTQETVYSETLYCLYDLLRILLLLS